MQHLAFRNPEEEGYQGLNLQYLNAWLLVSSAENILQTVWTQIRTDSFSQHLSEKIGNSGIIWESVQGSYRQDKTKFPDISLTFH